MSEPRALRALSAAQGFAIVLLYANNDVKKKKPSPSFAPGANSTSSCFPDSLTLGCHPTTSLRTCLTVSPRGVGIFGSAAYHMRCVTYAFF